MTKEEIHGELPEISGYFTELELEQLTASATFHELTARVREDQTQLQTAADELLAALPSILQSRPLSMSEAVAWGNILPRLTPDDGLLLVVAWLMKTRFPHLEWKHCVKLAALCVHNAWGQTIDTQRVESGVMAMIFTDDECELIKNKLPSSTACKILFEVYLVHRFPGIVARIFMELSLKKGAPFQYYWKAIYRALYEHELSRYRNEFTSPTTFVKFMCDHLLTTWKADIEQLPENIRKMFNKDSWMCKDEKPLATKFTPLTTGSGRCYPGYIENPWEDYEGVCREERDRQLNYKTRFNDLDTAAMMTDIAAYFSHWLDDGLPEPSTYVLRK
jgi:hypothetical protein